MIIHDKIIRLKSNNTKEMSPFLLTIFELVYETNAQTVLEIGVNRGTSTLAVLSALENKKSGMLYSVDINDDSKAIKNEELKKYWKFTQANSLEFYKNWNKEVDILIIDGNHKYNYCKSDYFNYYKFVKSGGYILLHDVARYLGLMQLWNGIEDNKIFVPVSEGIGIVQKGGTTLRDIAEERERISLETTGKKYILNKS